MLAGVVLEYDQRYGHVRTPLLYHLSQHTKNAEHSHA